MDDITRQFGEMSIHHGPRSPQQSPRYARYFNQVLDRLCNLSVVTWLGEIYQVLQSHNQAMLERVVGPEEQVQTDLERMCYSIHCRRSDAKCRDLIEKYMDQMRRMATSLKKKPDDIFTRIEERLDSFSTRQGCWLFHDYPDFRLGVKDNTHCRRHNLGTKYSVKTRLPFLPVRNSPLTESPTWFIRYMIPSRSPHNRMILFELDECDSEFHVNVTMTEWGKNGKKFELHTTYQPSSDPKMREAHNYYRFIARDGYLEFDRSNMTMRNGQKFYSDSETAFDDQWLLEKFMELAGTVNLFGCDDSLQ